MGFSGSVNGTTKPQVFWIWVFANVNGPTVKPVELHTFESFDCRVLGFNWKHEFSGGFSRPPPSSVAITLLTLLRLLKLTLLEHMYTDAGIHVLVSI